MLKLVLVALTTFFLSSCATPSYVVHVDSLAGAEVADAQTFALDHEIEVVDPLVWAEISGCVRRSLEARGWRAADEADADMIVYVSCSISGPEEYEYTTSTPVYGQTGTTTTYEPGNSYLGTTASTTTSADYGITHYSTQYKTGTRYHRRLKLTAVRADGTYDEPLWRTAVLSSGGSSDLRRMVPVLVVAAENWWGRSTGQVVTVRVPENDKALQRISGKTL